MSYGMGYGSVPTRRDDRDDRRYNDRRPSDGDRRDDRRDDRREDRRDDRRYDDRRGPADHRDRGYDDRRDDRRDDRNGSSRGGGGGGGGGGTFSSNNDSYGRDDRGDDRMGNLGSTLRDVDYRQERDVVDVKKDFYNMSRSVQDRSDADVRDWLYDADIRVTGRDPAKPVLKFSETHFPDEIQRSFDRQGFDAPTSIQSQAWTIALQGRDIVGVAKTGSGKTLAFGVPALIHIEAQPRLRRGDGPIALILAPTRELAVQIEEEMQKVMTRGTDSICVYGGAPKGPQQRKLRNGVQIVIATPGRLIDFLESRDTCLKRVTYLVCASPPF